MSVYYVCYDITNNRSRRKLVKLLESYGTRIQYSIFRCELSNDKLEEMGMKIRKLVRSFFLLDLSDESAANTLMEIYDEKSKKTSVIIMPVCSLCEKKIIALGDRGILTRKKNDYEVI